MARRAFAVVAALLALAGGVHADSTKPIRLVVPFAPGGSSEIVARTVAAFIRQEQACWSEVVRKAQIKAE